MSDFGDDPGASDVSEVEFDEELVGQPSMGMDSSALLDEELEEDQHDFGGGRAHSRISWTNTLLKFKDAPAEMIRQWQRHTHGVVALLA